MKNVQVYQLPMSRGTPTYHKKPKRKQSNKTVLFYATINEELVKQVDEMIEKDLFKSRSEAMREALKDLVGFYK